jgi:hypothetical protein
MILGIAVDFERLALSAPCVVEKESRVDVGRGGASPQTSGETEPAEPTLGVGRDGACGRSTHRGGANPRGSDEAWPMASVAGRGGARQAA